MAEVTKVMTAAVDGFIRPGYDAFHESAGKMTTAMKALCETPSKTSYDAAKGTFRDAAVSWAHIEVVRVGPVIEQNRFERILFYPDRKSTGLKQVQSVLSKLDETATDPTTLGTKSVAMQGFGALEYVLSGTGSDELLKAKNSYRCRYGAAIAGNITNVAKELSDIWDAPDGIQKAWEQPGPDNPDFRTGGEAITALLGILVHGAEAVRDQRIETFTRARTRRNSRNRLRSGVRRIPGPRWRAISKAFRPCLRNPAWSHFFRKRTGRLSPPPRRSSRR